LTFDNIGVEFHRDACNPCAFRRARLARSRRMRCAGVEQRIAAAKFIAAEVSPQEKA